MNFKKKPVNRGWFARRLALAALVTSIMTGSAVGSDASSGVLSPKFSMESTGAGSVRHAFIKIDPNAVTIEMNINVSPGESRNASIVTPLFSWRGEADPYPDRQYPELQIRVNGRPAVFHESFKAFVNTTDISNELSEAGLDPFAIVESPPIVDPVPGKTTQFNMLEKIGGVSRDDGLYLARWSARRIIQMQLPTGASTVAMTYKSRPAYRLQSLEELGRRELLSKYCLSPKGLSEGLGLKNRDATVVAEEHAITVRDATTIPLTVTVASGNQKKPRDVVFFCSEDGKSLSARGMRTAKTSTNPSGVFSWLLVKPVQ